MSPTLRVYVTWEEVVGFESSIAQTCEVLQSLRLSSTVVTLSRINTLLALERFRENDLGQGEIQSFLARNFITNDLLVELFQKCGPNVMKERGVFHSQQVLTLIRFALGHCTPDGKDTEEDQEARFRLGECLLRLSDQLVPNDVALRLREKRGPKSKKAMLLQLSSASGMEVNNPPDMVSSIARSEVIFREMLKDARLDLDIDRIFEERTGMNISDYLDFQIGTLINYLARNPTELLENANVNFMNSGTFFGKASQEKVKRFWSLEASSIEDYVKAFGEGPNLAFYHNLIPFRRRPFLRLADHRIIPVHPCFVMEKLEIGLFWTIFNALETAEERNALFRSWGRLFEMYVSDTLSGTVNCEGDKFWAFPRYADNEREAFDSMLLSKGICVVFECKGGFLKSEAKFSDDVEKLMPDLHSKFGTDKSGAVRQLVSNITQVFARSPHSRREISGLNLEDVRVVIPVLVVQENFVSSPLTSFYLADVFRDELRKQRLSRDIGCLCQGLITVHISETEKMKIYAARSSFHLASCLLERSKLGDGPFDFHDFLRTYANQNSYDILGLGPTEEKFKSVLNRVSMTFFQKPLE